MNREQFKKIIMKSRSPAESLDQMVNEVCILAQSYADLKLMEWKKENILQFGSYAYVSNEEIEMSGRDVKLMARRKMFHDVVEKIMDDEKACRIGEEAVSFRGTQVKLRILIVKQHNQP